MSEHDTDKKTHIGPLPEDFIHVAPPKENTTPVVPTILACCTRMAMQLNTQTYR